jgi:hypothetical protein
MNNTVLKYRLGFFEGIIETSKPIKFRGIAGKRVRA